jgi:hypothetical protein
MPADMTSGPMPSAGIAAIEWVRMVDLQKESGQCE